MDLAKIIIDLQEARGEIIDGLQKLALLTDKLIAEAMREIEKEEKEQKE